MVYRCNGARPGTGRRGQNADSKSSDKRSGECSGLPQGEWREHATALVDFRALFSAKKY